MIKEEFREKSPIAPFLYVAYREHDRSQDPEIIVPECGVRFIRGVPVDEPPFHELHDRGYNYGFSNLPYRSISGFWGTDLREPGILLVRVNLASHKKIYVVDEQPFLDKRTALHKFSAATGLTRDAQQAKIALFASIAETLIPLANYDGNYKRPIYLIGRDLRTDEASFCEPGFRVRLREKAALQRSRDEPLRRTLTNEFLEKIDNPRSMIADNPSENKPKKPHLHLVQ